MIEFPDGLGAFDGPFRPEVRRFYWLKNVLLDVGDPEPQRLTDSDRDALRAYRRVVDRVRATGHGDLIEDQLEGFLSAVKADRHFRLFWAA